MTEVGAGKKSVSACARSSFCRSRRWRASGWTACRRNVLTETVFAWPGIGRLMYEALGSRDYNVVIGVFIVTSAIVILANLLVDLLYRFVDPRTRSA